MDEKAINYFKIILIVIITFHIACVHASIIDVNIEDKYRQVTHRGESVLMKESLALKLEQEITVWHWKPWIRTRTYQIENYVDELECFSGDSVDSFPDSIFTDEQLRKGAFILYVIFGIYSFTLLALVCNDYFIPSVEYICEDLNIEPNVGAATFMAVATSCPEFFVNVISTFVTESDMGIGTIVGSALFNALGVAAIGGLAAIRAIHIDWQPVTRDVVVYMINVGVLVAIVWDGVVMWHEALVLGILYIFYFVVMFNSIKIFSLVKKITVCCGKNKNIFTFDTEQRKDDEEQSNNGDKNRIEEKVTEKEEPQERFKDTFIFSKEKSVLAQTWWLFTFPLRAILAITIPSPKLYRKVYPVSFVMCIVWIGVNSYLVSWSMTVIGHTFMLPDSVMGMTFLAFGGCLPEACSIYIMSRRGEGSMGVSNAIGANSLAILFALGVPWLIRTLSLLPTDELAAIHINSSGIDFVVGSILVAVLCLWITLYTGRYILRKRLGFVLIFLYLIFITFAILVEMGVILDREVRVC